VRFARAGEKLVLLNGEQPALGADVLVIADERKALALAGIMGGGESAVSATTTDIFLESAYFSPEVIAGKSRVLGFGTDASYRFERGVDYAGARDALERATGLVLEICGGEPGALSEARAALPERRPVTLRLARAERLLGIELQADEVAAIFRRLGFTHTAPGPEFSVTPPTFRFDIAIEEDLIEEVARIHGYENIPAALPQAVAALMPLPETQRTVPELRQALVARDYQEIVTFSFVEQRWEEDFCGNSRSLALANPISSHMGVMRSSLIGSLVNCVAFNVSRKQPRVRLFEVGRCFLGSGADAGTQPMRVAAIAFGPAAPEQWGQPRRNVDFYDAKADVEALLAPWTGRFEAAAHPAFHPGRCARIVQDGVCLGWIGELHPRWQEKYGLPLAPVVFELDFRLVAARMLPVYREIPRFPVVRRDISAEFDEGIEHDRILAALRQAAPPIVAEIGLFDLFREGGVGKGKKSLAFRVLLQDTEKTLSDAEVDPVITGLRDLLQQQFKAKLR
jgi:phenylalanyl-tRNA synthetase beta chain